MKALSGVAGAALLLSLAAPAAAQTPDAYVLPFGQIRLESVGEYERYDARFDAAGDEQPLGAALGEPLLPGNFAPLGLLAGQLTDFYTGLGDAVPSGIPALTAGTPTVVFAESQVRAPLGLWVGVLPRLEVGGRLWFAQDERVMQGLALESGDVGANPDPVANAALLAPYGAAAEALGASALLPVAGTELGDALRARVSALTGGGELSLPEVATDSAGLETLLATAYGVPLRSRRADWRPAALDLDARALLLSTFGAAPVPTSASGAGLRVAAGGRLRLPVGPLPDTVEIAAGEDRVRRSDLGGALTADVFLGRLWVTAQATATRSGATAAVHRLAPPDAPLASTTVSAVTVKPGSEMRLTVVPRFRLAAPLSLGLEYSVAHFGDTEIEAAGVAAEPAALSLAGGISQRFGVNFRYSMLPDWWAGGFRFPAEVELRYTRELSGPEGWPRGRTASVTARLHPQFWGRRPARRTAPAPLPAAPPPAPPTGG